MGYQDGDAGLLRKMLSARNDVTEKHMFGGLVFMVAGHMCCGVDARDYMFRVGPRSYDAALNENNVRPCDITGRPMKGLVMVALSDAPEADLDALLAMSLAFVAGLPKRV